MKYLETYKIFESETIPQSIIDEVMDIGRDIVDNGFNITYDKVGKYLKCLVITLAGDRYEEFSLSEIRDFLDSISRYLESEDYNSRILFMGADGKFHDIDTFKKDYTNNISDDRYIVSSMFRINIAEK